MADPIETGAEALYQNLTSEHGRVAVTAEYFPPFAELAVLDPGSVRGFKSDARAVLASLGQHRDDITRVLDRHSEYEVDDHGNVRCACAETAWFDDVLEHHDHVTTMLLAWLIGEAS